MPLIDKECEGEGATHSMACKCREEYFAKLQSIVEDLSVPNRMSETEGTLLRKFELLREKARAALGAKDAAE